MSRSARSGSPRAARCSSSRAPTDRGVVFKARARAGHEALSHAHPRDRVPRAGGSETRKLFTNVWRYIRFATANQLFMMANDFGLDYEKIRQALSLNYRVPRDLPGRRLQCRSVPLQGHDAARGVQQQQLPAGPGEHDGQRRPPALPRARLEQQHDLTTSTVGILGMAFKGESDDIGRASPTS